MYFDQWGLSEKDVTEIIKQFHKTIKRLTESGKRYQQSHINNILKFYKIKPDYLGCGQQEEALREDLNSLKLDDKWNFQKKQGKSASGLFTHQWAVAKSTNPDDPIVVLDPWADTVVVDYGKSDETPYKLQK